ncbi:MAG: squalene--hopene cyclase, partial [Planctomycetaceae bacterium]|nr:squalene--hopene cyclase [Planctomycetaceae bacterium]
MSFSVSGPHDRTSATLRESGAVPRLDEAIDRTRSWLLDQQHDAGYWLGELEGDTILESEYILLLTYLGRGQSEIAKKCAAYIRKQQLPTGGWALYPGGPLEISASVKAYWVLKITGLDPHGEEMTRARDAIRAAGGAERVNSFTRYYFALLGIIAYKQCPAVPPELMFLPSWCPLNIYEMSSWSRTILVPLSLLWAYQPSCKLPPEHHFDELFLNSPDQLPVTMPPAEQVDAMKRQSWLPWHQIFSWVDRIWKGFETVGLKPLRPWAIQHAANWMTERFERSDGLGAIFPPIIWSIVALKCLGHTDDSELVQAALFELEKLTIEEDETARLEPCRSPVWDTAIATLALRESGVPASHPKVTSAVEWLLSKEVRQRGDWTVRKPHLEPGGWYFEFNNEFYPDI